MLRLTVVMCAAIYAVLVIYSDRAPARAPALVAESQRLGPASLSNQMQHLATTDGRRLTVAAVIDPGRVFDRSGQVPLIQTPHAGAVAATSRPADPAAPLHHLVGEVTGAAVNLRAGPSTQEAVVTSLLRGDRVEVLGATGTGWAQIRTVPSGLEGFMAARFLTPVN